MTDPFLCERCGSELESDDAISVIEGVCALCRRVADEGESGLSSAINHRGEAEDASTDDPVNGSSWEGFAEEVPEPGISDTTGVEYGGIRPPPVPIIPTQMANPRRPNRARRRARDLAIGVTLGLVVTCVITAYFLTRQVEVRSPAMTKTPSVRPVTLRVQPPWAVARLDGEVMSPPGESGKLPLSLPLDDGTIHWLEVSADGYHSVRRSVSAVSGVDEVFVELVRRPYEVTIQTNPTQAEVWVNDELKGHSPLTFSLLPEEKPTLAIKRSGYTTVTQQLAPPERGECLELDLALPVAGPMLLVETDPAGAEIVVDGTAQGVAPLTIEFDPSYLGKDVAIVASAAGHDDAATQVALPQVGGEEARAVRLTLNRSLAEVELWTVPPGGRVLIEGEDLGPAPVTAKFDPSETGKSVVVQASLAGSYYGKQKLIVPPPGEPLRVTVSLEFNAQRVAFLLALPADTRADCVVLKDQAVELIHRLTPEQRFAVLAQTDEGIETWPGGLGTKAATSEQKVRAYDMIRSVRPSASGDVLEMMQTSLGFRPTTVWLLSAGELTLDDLLPFDDWAKGRDVSVHVVRTTTTAGDDRLREWTARHDGTLTVLGHEAPPMLALDRDDGE